MPCITRADDPKLLKEIGLWGKEAREKRNQRIGIEASRRARRKEVGGEQQGDWLYNRQPRGLERGIEGEGGGSFCRESRQKERKNPRNQIVNGMGGVKTWKHQSKKKLLAACRGREAVQRKKGRAIVVKIQMT